jgi:hypothetical protein
VCPIERVESLVTDDEATDEQVAAFQAIGVRVFRV